MIMRKVRPLTFPRVRVHTIFEGASLGSRGNGVRSHVLLAWSMRPLHTCWRLSALLSPRVLDSAEASGNVSRDQGLWPPIRSNDMLVAALAACGMV